MKSAVAVPYGFCALAAMTPGAGATPVSLEAPDPAAFMGEIVVQSPTKTKDSDVAQAHYIRIISPRGAEQGFMARALSGNFVYIGAFKSFDRSPAPESAHVPPSRESATRVC